MKRFFIAVVVAALAATTVPAQAETPWRWNECRFQFLDGRRNFSVEEVKLTIACVADHFGVSRSTAMYIAERESRFGQFATNPTSGACGVFQHIPRYFPGRLVATPDRYKPFGGSCYNARDNVFAALYMAKNSGWSAWSVY